MYTNTKQKKKRKVEKNIRDAGKKKMLTAQTNTIQHGNMGGVKAGNKIRAGLYTYIQQGHKKG